MLTRSYYVCESELCNCEWTKGEVIWGLTDAKVVYGERLVETLCSECGSVTEEMKIVEEYYCPDCTGLLKLVERLIKKDNAPQLMGVPYKVPIHSDALALTSENVAEHKEKFPDIEIDSENRPVFTNAKQHDDYMKKCGIVKPMSSNKKRGTIFSIPGTSCHRGRDVNKCS